MSKTTKAIAALGLVAGLSIATLPFSASAADDSVDVTVKLKIADVIAISTDATANTVDLGTLTNGGAVQEGSVKVKVVTNNSTGYQLTLTDKDTDTNMVSSTATTDVIPAGVPAQSDSTSAWGFKGGLVTSYKAVVPSTGTADVIATQNTPTSSAGVETEVTFGANASASQAAGEYSDVVTFTASEI